MMWELIKLEAKKLFRKRWVVPITLLMVILFAWSFEYRSSAVKLNHAQADTAYTNQLQKKNDYLKELDSAVYFGKKYSSFTINPLNANRYNNAASQMAVYKFSPLAIISTGQSDLFGEEYVITAPAREPGLKLEDIANPMQRLFGNIDPAFVLVFLLPLLIIAVCYSFISSERETDTLQLLLVQTRSFKKWVWAKLLLLIGFFSFIFITALIVLLWKYNASVTLFPAQIPGTAFILFIYIAFWCTACLLANLYFKKSAAAAIALSGLWMILVFVLPSLINFISTSVYKVPSRLEYITKYRSAYSEAEKAGKNEMLNKYFFDHPELSKPDTSNQRIKDNLFAMQTIALYENIRKATLPITTQYDNLKQQSNRLASYLQVVSPAALFNSALNDIAGTSEKDYRQFNTTAQTWRLKHLEYIKQKIFADADMKKEEVMNRPEFNFKIKTAKRLFAFAGLLGLYVVLLAGLCSRKLNKFEL